MRLARNHQVVGRGRQGQGYYRPDQHPGHRAAGAGRPRQAAQRRNPHRGRDHGARDRRAAAAAGRLYTQRQARRSSGQMRARTFSPQELKDLWGGFRQRVEPVIGAIGRIERPIGEHIGTGFVVAEGLIATNRHVLGALDVRLGRFLPRIARRSFSSRKSAPRTPARTRCRSSLWPRSTASSTWCFWRFRNKAGRKVSVDMAQAAEGKRVVAIGYPAEDRRNNPLFLAVRIPGTVRRTARRGRRSARRHRDAFALPRLLDDAGKFRIAAVPARRAAR